MKIAAIIAEYNPFHNGHKYQIDLIKTQLDVDSIIVITSGNYVQRGELSIIDKYEKARVAIDNGVDLVLELPFVYSCATAEIFAGGAVRILDNLGMIDYLCFGMEDVDRFSDLISISKILINESKEYKTILKLSLSEGMSYIEARQHALSFISKSDVSFMSKPNNILACEYVKELLKCNSEIKPYPIKRTVSYDSIESKDIFLSASGIRKKIRDNIDISKYVPASVKYVINDAYISETEQFVSIKNSILAMGPEGIKKYPDVETGLDYRLYNSVYAATSMEDFVNNTYTKRYTKSRIRRILTHILTGYTNDELQIVRNYTPGYIKTLGFNSNGKILLRSIKNNGIQIYNTYDKSTNKLEEIDKLILNRNLRADNIYLQKYKQLNNDYYELPYIM